MRRRSIDLEAMELRVRRRATVETEDGTQVDDDFHRIWRKALKEAGISPDLRLPAITRAFIVLPEWVEPRDSNP